MRRLVGAVAIACLAIAAGGASAQAHKKTAQDYEAEADALLAKLNAEHPEVMQSGGAPPAVRTTSATTTTTTIRTARTATTVASAGAGGGGLVSGRYTCIAGFRPMLTLGEMTIAGGGYRFHPPTGPDTQGGYSMTGGAIRWSGDIGVIKNNRITESGLDAHKPDFYFKYYAYDGAKLPTTAACQKL